ncbi:MAG: class I tRNA ligase family protein, partial [Candidatus Paceibacterota bacterium]
FKNYGKLSGQALQDKMQQSRDDVHVDPDKKNKEDFVLWFKLTGKHKNHTMRWSSPWGEGFPGWHIECSAMSMEYLGETIDIHAGGVDHIAVHHENEIAQSECATNKPFVNHWFHSEFLKVNGTKMSKSLKNIYTIEDIQKKNIDPLSLRYLYLQTHYRKVLNFTWEALTGAQQALYNLRELIVQMKKEDRRTELSEDKLQKIQEFARTFNQALANDLQIPQALSIIWQVTKSNIPSPDKLDLISEYDKVLGLDLISVKEDAVPASVIKLADERLKARKLGDFKTADRLRKQIMQLGYKLKDTPEGYKISKLRSKHIA